jgi:hypothetical protein
MFSLSQSGPSNLNHVLNVQSASTFLNTTITLAYMVDVISPSTNMFERYSGGVTSPDPLTEFDFSLSSTPAGMPNNPVSVSDPNSTTTSSKYMGSVTSAAFTNTLVTSGGAGATQFTNLLVQKAPVTQTPSPLPILGASLGFGFSRRLRNRIKAAA